MNDEYILDYFYGLNRKRINKKLLNNIPNDIKNYLHNRYVDSTCDEETIIRIYLNINEHPKCICGKPCKFIGKRSRVFLKSCGDKECEHAINQLHLQKTCIDRYGVSNPAKCEHIKEKTKSTCIEKYGVSSVLLNKDIHKKSVQTNIKKYGYEYSQQSDIVKHKIAASNKETCLKKYGVDNILKVQYIRDKQLQTCLERYGVDNVLKVAEIQQQINQTCIEKYGVPYASQNAQIKEKILDSFIIHNIDKYGCAFPIQNDEVKVKAKTNYIKSFIKKYGVDNPAKVSLIYEKILNTKRKNNSFNISRQEDTVYELLKEKYTSIHRNYKSDKYPFLCDFYIEDIDTYIECNFHWTHGKHFYNANDENDILKLSKWRNKNTKYYDNAIHTWTVRDVLKLKTATENKLNYMVFWTTNEVKVWLKNTR